jgi:unsaturated chondroitin disaccharide hydrolase
MISSTRPSEKFRRLLALCAALTGAASPLLAQAPAGDDPLLRSIPATFEIAGKQYEHLLASVKDDPEIPRTFVDGKVVTVRTKDWTSGFIAGSLWYLYEFSKDPKWLAAAQDYTVRLDSIKDYRGSHDLGFMLGCSYGHGYRLTKNPDYQKVLLQGAASLSTRFNPTVGQIRSWDHGSWNFPVIIDNMMNLEFLMSAARESGESRFKEISISHADNTLKNHFRPDSSSFHVVDYDPATGEVLAKKTHQGAADDSAWARGQAWALYGYTMMFRETKNAIYLEQAVKIGNFILNHPRLPADKVPYWDFDAPGIPAAPRDASAGAIMSSAFLELSGMTKGEQSASFLNLARQQLTSLSSPAYLAKPGENGGFILLHSVGHLPKNSEVDVPLNYADYYFIEALIRYQNLSKKP